MLMKRRGVEMRLIINGATPPSSVADPALVKAIARAYRWFEDLQVCCANCSRSMGHYAHEPMLHGGRS
jgi:hypothetical protein